MIYKGPDNSGVVIKLVKEQGTPVASFDVIQYSKSRESTILYQEKVLD
jgi:hypothetical protein